MGVATTGAALPLGETTTTAQSIAIRRVVESNRSPIDLAGEADQLISPEIGRRTQRPITTTTQAESKGSHPFRCKERRLLGDLRDPAQRRRTLKELGREK